MMNTQAIAVAGLDEPLPGGGKWVRSDGSNPWLQRVGALATMQMHFAEHAGFDELLKALGVSAADLADPDNRIPYRVAARLFAECVRRTRCEHAGLLLGQEWRLRDLGLVGELTLNCDTVGDALTTLVAYHQLNSQGGSSYLMERDRHAVLGYVMFHPEVDEFASVFDAVMAMGACFLRELCGELWSPTVVHLPRAQPRNAAIYREYFRAPVRFNAERALLVFDRQLLSQPVRGASPDRRAALEARALRSSDCGFVHRVYRAVRMQLLRGSGGGDDIAQQLLLQRRTFNRRLGGCGLTYQAVLDEVRYSVGRQLLRDTDLPIIDIAAALGYGDSGNFSRAFRRWAGQAPANWRCDARKT